MGSSLVCFRCAMAPKRQGKAVSAASKRVRGKKSVHEDDVADTDLTNEELGEIETQPTDDTKPDQEENNSESSSSEESDKEEEEEQEEKEGVRKESKADSGKAPNANDESNVDLNAKVAKYREMVTQGTVKDPQALLKSMFGRNEMCALWNRLGTVLKGSNKKVQAQWNKVCQLGPREGKQLKKLKVLCVHLAFPDKFESKVVEELQIINEDQKGMDAEWLYKGELEQKHGKEEAARHISSGKWEMRTDEDGEPMYRKRRHWDRHAESTKQTVSGTKNSDDPDFYASTVQAMKALSSASSQETLQDKAKLKELGAPKTPKEQEVPTAPMLKRTGSGLVPGVETPSNLLDDQSSTRSSARGKDDKKEKKVKHEKDKKVKEDKAIGGIGKVAGADAGTPQAKAHALVAALSATSIKIITMVENMKPTRASAALIALGRELHTDLEAERSQVLKICVNKKSGVEELQVACVKAAEKLEEGNNLIRLLKPHLEQESELEPKKKAKNNVD